MVSSEKRLALALEAAELGIWDWDLTTNSMMWSERAKDIAGFPRDQPVTFEQVRKSTHPEDYPRTSAMAVRSLDPEIRAREPYEYRIIRPDGSIRWVLAHGEAVFTEAGGMERAVRYTGTIQDITARHVLELANREQTMRLHLALDAAGLGVWDFDISTNALRSSPELNRMLGYADDAALDPEDVRSHYHPEDREKVRAAGEQALARGETQFQTEYRYETSAGLRWHSVRAQILLSSEGVPSRVIGVVMDITERKKTEERLEQAVDRLQTERERLALALRAADAGAWELDVPGNLVWDKTFYDVVGLDPEKYGASGPLFLSLLHPDDQAKARAEHQKTNSGIPPVQSVEYRLLRPDGKWIWIESQRVSRKKGDGLNVLGVTQDITRRKENEERLTALLREVSHRVKNQFAVMLAMVRSVGQQSISPDELHSAIETRVHALSRAQDLLVDKNWQGVSLREILTAQIEPFGMGSFEISGPLATIKPAAVQYLAMAFFELATNAAKYGALSSPNGKVAVEWRIDGDVVKVIWRETGGPAPAKGAPRQGFGRKMLQQIAPAAVSGTVEMDFAPSGLVWSLLAKDILMTDFGR